MSSGYIEKLLNDIKEYLEGDNVHNEIMGFVDKGFEIIERDLKIFEKGGE